MVRRARLRTGPGAVASRAASRELPAVPAAPEARQLFGRAGHGEAQKPAVHQLAMKELGERHLVRTLVSPCGRRRPTQPKATMFDASKAPKPALRTRVTAT